MMDFFAWLTPGAQQLAAKAMDEGWTAARDLVARRIGRGSKAPTATATESLDAARLKALTAGAQGQDELRIIYFAGFLDGLAAGRPDLADLTQGLEARKSDNPQPAAANHNTANNGVLIQVARDINGGIKL